MAAKYARLALRVGAQMVLEDLHMEVGVYSRHRFSICISELIGQPVLRYPKQEVQWRTAFDRISGFVGYSTASKHKQSHINLKDTLSAPRHITV